ncbi:MAG: InlB B-repeat-containing protein [Erysipelotrichaceae bacterium]|nr:InlB B-repeat-containing protein [Erysipelotrichaceae bacterium]
MKKAEKKILSILLSCMMSLGTLPSLTLAVRAEEELATEEMTETMHEGTPEETAVIPEEQPEIIDEPAEEEWVEEQTIDYVPMEEMLVEEDQEVIVPEEEEVLSEEQEETILEDADSADAEEAVAEEVNEDTGPEDLPAEVNIDEEQPDEPEAMKADPAEDETEAAEEDETEEIHYPAFNDAMTVNGITVTVFAEEGVFPEGAVLSVEQVPAEARTMVDEAVDNERDADLSVAVSYTFDIMVLDAEGNELQPKDGQTVTVSFSAAEAADSNLDAAVYHISDDGEATVLAANNDGNTIEAVTDGFSYYTVEFTYGSLQYELPGEGTVELSTILSTLGLTGEVSNAQSSAPELFSVENTGGIWTVASHQSFTTNETLTVTINSVDYVIKVTDPESYNVWVGGKKVTSDYLNDVLRDGTGSVKFDPVSNTLTLDNPNITGMHGEIIIYAARVDLTITGKAVLQYPGALYGIEVYEGSLTISGVNTDITVKVERDAGVAIRADKDITITGGTVDAKGEHSGIYSHDGMISISGGKITAYGEWQAGILAHSDLRISGGTVNATNYMYGAIGSGLISENGNVIIKNGDVTAIGFFRGIHSIHGNVNISGGTVRAKATGDYNEVSAIDCWYDGNITISGGTVLAECGNSGIGTTKLWTSGLRTHTGDITISGGSVTTKMVDDGIRSTPTESGAGGDITISGGTVNAEGTRFGIWTKGGEITISGGTVIVTGELSYGIHSNPEETNNAGDITISGGIITITGGELGVFSGTSGGMYGSGYSGDIIFSGEDTIVTIKGGKSAVLLAETDDASITILSPLGIVTPAGGMVKDEQIYKVDETTVATDVVIRKACKVTFDSNGHGPELKPQYVAYNTKVSEPSHITEEGYTFGGWYSDPALTSEYDFDTPVTAELTLYARWMVHVNGLNLHADGTEQDGTYYRLKTDVLEPVFEKDTGEVTFELGHLCTDSDCSDVIMSLPEKGTTYYFRVYMKDPSSYDKGVQLVMFLPEIKDNLSASAEEALIEFDWITGTPNGDAVTLQFKYTEEEITYTITQGADAVWTKGGKSGLEYIVKRNINDDKTYSLFESIEMDGAVVDASNYSAAAGSLSAVLSPSYLNTLSPGTHTVKFNFKDGSAETTLTVKKKPVKTTGGTEDSGGGTWITVLPNTGDSGNLGLWISLLFLSLISIAGLMVYHTKFTE